MNVSEHIKAYTDAVCQQIRWKPAHKPIAQEVEAHILDQQAALLSAGLEEKAAAKQAVEEMGDPVTIGQEMDRIHRPRPDWFMVCIIGALLAVGVVMQYFLAPPDVLSGVASSYWMRQLLAAVIGMGVFLAVYFLDYTILGKHGMVIYLLLILVGIALYQVSPVVYGRHVYVAHIALLLIATFPGVIYSQRQGGYTGLFQCLFCGLAGELVLLWTPIMGGAICFCLSYVIMLTVAVVKGWFGVKKPILLGILYLPMVVNYAFSLGYAPVRERIFLMFHPQLDPEGAGYIGTVIQRILTQAQPLGAAFGGSGLAGVIWRGDIFSRGFAGGTHQLYSGEFNSQLWLAGGDGCAFDGCGAAGKNGADLPSAEERAGLFCDISSYAGLLAANCILPLGKFWYLCRGNILAAFVLRRHQFGHQHGAFGTDAVGCAP